MSDRIIASQVPGGVLIAVHGRDGLIVTRTVLSPRRAMLLGLDLCNLATGPFFRLEGKEMPAQEDPGRANTPPASAGSHEG